MNKTAIAWIILVGFLALLALQACQSTSARGLTPIQQLLLARVAADQAAAEVLRGLEDDADVGRAMVPYNVLAAALDEAVAEYQQTGRLGSGQPLLDAAAAARTAYLEDLARQDLSGPEREIRARRADSILRLVQLLWPALAPAPPGAAPLGSTDENAE